MKTARVKELLEDLKIKPLKSLGQNFLIDEGVIQKICSYKDLGSYSKVIEIGPGLGSLTENFDSFKSKVSLVELDKTIARYWKEKNYDVHHMDALKFSWEGLPPNSVLISNLPYQISSRLLIELFCVDAPISDMILMFQKEVGERIKADPADKKTYGLLSIVCELGWKVKTVTKAPNQCFYPSPEIESVVLAFEKIDGQGIKNRKKFVQHLKSLFGARRKKMRSVLKKHKVTWSDKYRPYLDMRPDQLDAQEHLELFLFLEENHV